MTLLVEVAGLLDDALVVYSEHPASARLEAARARLSEPLRVAVAGKLKAGKSTLLNALVGERLAPTDAGECTRIVTWYVDSHTTRISVHPRSGPARQATFRRANGALDIDLAGLSADEIDHLVVEWPSQRLRAMSLVDTPGIDSLSADLSQRSYDFLTPGEAQETPADAVLYLMRHLHRSDVRFLEAFHDDDVAQATPVNAIGVLSRADEIGVCRLDAMDAATRIATRYRHEPQVRRLCQTVVPVAGLLAETAGTLGQDEYEAIRHVAAAEPTAVEEALLSVDRFVTTPMEGVGGDVRSALLTRLGLFGVRLAVSLVHDGTAPSAPRMAAELRRASGIEALESILLTQFAHRRDVLKARAALAVVDAVLRDAAVPGSERVAAGLERVEAGAHALVELRLMNALQAGTISLPDQEDACRLLAGGDPADRLGLEPSAAGDPAAVREAALGALARWQRRAADPMANRAEVEAATVVVRTCEGIVSDLTRDIEPDLT